MNDSQIIEKLREVGIDHERLKEALDSHDNWGKLVHSFVYLAVLSVVEQALKEAEQGT